MHGSLWIVVMPLNVLTFGTYAGEFLDRSIQFDRTFHVDPFDKASAQKLDEFLSSSSFSLEVAVASFQGWMAGSDVQLLFPDVS